MSMFTLYFHYCLSYLCVVSIALVVLNVSAELHPFNELEHKQIFD